MGNSGKVAIGAALAAVGMLVLTAVTLEEPVMFTFLGLVAVAYVAAVTEVFARRRYLAVVAAWRRLRDCVTGRFPTIT